MPRGLPWSHHTVPTGKRPVFYAELALTHQTWQFGLVDLLPGKIQGRVSEWSDLFFQLRGGQDDLHLKLVNAPHSALGKGLRCRGANTSVGVADGSYVAWTVNSGTPFNPAAAHSAMILFKAWKVAQIPTGGAFVMFRRNHFRFVVYPTGTITLETFSLGVWSVAFTDSGAFREGDLCAVIVTSDGVNDLNYYRRSDSGDHYDNTFANPFSSANGTDPLIANGDTDAAIANTGAEGRYCPSLDIDEIRWWNRQVSKTEFQAFARRTLNPLEAADANLVAWSPMDEGNGTTTAVRTNTGANITATLGFETSDGLIAGLTYPSWISGITRDRLTDHISGNYPIEGASVKLYVTFTDPVTVTPVELLRGRVREMVRADRHLVELDVVDVSTIVHKQLGNLVDLTSYPYAPSDSVGKMLPLVFGSVPNMPGLRVQAASSTRLAASCLTADTTLTVDTTSGFLASGSVRIDDEVINYTGKTSTTFTGCTRGASGTIATSHVTGAQVMQQTTESYIFADHAVSAITNIRKVNSRGEYVPAASSEYVVILTAPAGVIFPAPPRVTVQGEGSLWLSIDMEAVTAYNTALNGNNAARLNAAWTETNYATLNAANPKLSIKRTSDFAGPTLSSGVLKAYAVYEHHRMDTLVFGESVAASAELGGVPLVALGNLTPQTNTPANAKERGDYHTESAGFDAAHQHDVANSDHQHDIGPGTLSTVIRPVGALRFFAVPVQPTGVPPYPGGPNAYCYTANPLFQTFKNLAVDGDGDTYESLGFAPVNRFPFGNLRNTNRQIKRVRVVIVASGSAGLTMGLYIKGVLITSTPPLGALGSGLKYRQQFLSPTVDITSQNIVLADLLRPDSYIGPTIGLGAAQVFEIYLQAELDQTAASTDDIRPTFDNWPKPLPKVRDGQPETFEPSVWIGNEPLNWPPLGANTGYGFINPNLGGPALPFNSQVQPSLKLFFTELANPFAALKKMIVKIAHSNPLARGAAYSSTVFSTPPPAIPVPNSTQPTWPFTTPANFAPVYHVRVWIRGQLITRLSFTLDMTQVGQGQTAITQAAYAVNAWLAGGPCFTMVQNTLAGQPTYTQLAAGSARVESNSGWQDVHGLGPGGVDFRVQDLIDPTSYIEIVLPPPTVLDRLEAISPGPPLDPTYSTQNPSYGHFMKWCQKLYDVALEVETEDATSQIALPVDVGGAVPVQALAHSSLTWFDITALWLLVNNWNAMRNIEMVATATGFGANAYVRVLRINTVIEFGTVSLEDTHKIVADVDQGGGGNPIDHVARIFDTYLGSAYKNTSAFSAAHALVRTDAAGVVTERKNSKDVIDNILRQYSCSGHWEAGLFVPLFKPLLSSLGAGSPTFDIDGVVRESAEITRTPTDEIVNEVEVLYGKRFVEGGFAGLVYRESNNSKTVYGKVSRQRIEGDWLWTSAAAQAHADNVLDYQNHASVLVTFETYLNGLDVVRGDIIGLTLDWRTGTKLEVLEMGISPGGVSRMPKVRLVTADRADKPA